MPRRKASSNTKTPSFSPKKLTQTTLPDLLGSASVSTSPAKSVFKPKSSPSSKRTRAKSRRVPFSRKHDGGGSSSDVGAIHFEEKVADTSSEASEDEQPRLSPMKRRRTRVNSFDNIEVINDNHVRSDDEGDLQVRWKGKGKGKQNVVVESDGSGQSNKRRLVRGVRPPAPEDEDDMSDLDKDQILDNRMRNRDRKTAFQMNLEKLKRKKQGKATSDSSQSDSENEADDSSTIPFEGARPNGDSDDESVDEATPTTEEDSFIVEDDNTFVPDLPAMFSMNTHQDLAHHFKIICQLFVHLVVSPANKRRKTMESVLRDNEYFSLPLQIARRKLSGMRDSLVASSIWRPQFKKLLETYPKLKIVMLDFAVPACDACNLGGRMSTRIGRLSGSPYNRMGFKALRPGDLLKDGESDEDKSSMEFHLGRFCAKRTKVFHQFTHWEYDLFNFLSREVEELRNPTGFVRVAFAGGTQPPDNIENGDEIMEWLDERKIIEMEWVKIKDMMESALHLDLAVKKGEED